MSPRTARGNRLGLALVGLAMLTAGGYGLLRGTGLLPGRSGAEPVVPASLRGLAQTEVWLWPAVATLAALVALLALRWLLVQARTDRLRQLVLDEDAHEVTYADARAFAIAVAEEMGSLSGVRRARAALVEGRAGAQLRVSVAVDDGVDVAELRAGVMHTLTDARRSLEVESLPAVVRLHTGRIG